MKVLYISHSVDGVVYCADTGCFNAGITELRSL